jgi:hypothetical protein
MEMDLMELCYLYKQNTKTKGGEEQMAIKVHGEKSIPEVSLKLASDAEGVVVMAVDAEGKEIKGGNILRITNDGMLVRIPHLSKNIGVKLNKLNQILMKKVESK